MNAIKVLLVDDDVMLSSIITAALKDEGYEVHYQSSLTGITTILNEFKPDIMVLDVEIGTSDSIDNASGIKNGSSWYSHFIHIVAYRKPRSGKSTKIRCRSLFEKTF